MYVTTVVLAAVCCRTASVSLLAARSSYAGAVRILHEYYLPLLPLAAAVELTINTYVCHRWILRRLIDSTAVARNSRSKSFVR